MDRDPRRERGSEALDPSRLWLLPLAIEGVAVVAGVRGCAVGKLRTREDFESEGFLNSFGKILCWWCPFLELMFEDVTKEAATEDEAEWVKIVEGDDVLGGE